MKKLFSLSLVSVLLLASMAFSPASTHNSKKTTVTVYVANGTAWGGSLSMSGTISSYGTSGYYFAGNYSTGTYTVTINNGAPGSHLYQFTGGYSQNSSSGSVTFNNVSVTANSTASIY